MTKYRIVKEVDCYRTVYRVQHRFLWLFWIKVYDKTIYFDTLDKAIIEIKLLNYKNTKEVVYEE